MPDVWNNPELAEKWTKIRKVRDDVLAAIEPYRADKTIGSSLEAHPIVTVDDAYAKAIDGIDLAEICITSQVTVENGNALAVTFEKAEGNKCQRCWKILPEVGSDPDYPDLSLRDADSVRWYLKNKKAA